MMVGMATPGAPDASTADLATPVAGQPSRRAFRSTDDRMLAGICGGLADHLGLTATQVRLGFLALALVGGLGVVIYAGLWIMLPVDGSEPTGDGAPGVEAMTRRGFRSPFRPGEQIGGRDAAVGLSLSALVVGAFALAQAAGVGVQTRWFWPILVGCAGLGLLWWQSDESARQAWLSPSSSWKTWVRALVGLVLALGAASIAVFTSGVRGQIATALAAVVLALIGVALVLGPWLLRTTRALRVERAERIRTQERADVAAHLHDSVLQTLALIQRQSHDPQAVAGLARTQERELRRWLFESPEASHGSLAAALRDLAAEVEDTHGEPVEVVVVGDVLVGERFAPLLAATREALVNAARHSGAGRVDVYAEVDARQVEVFVRDRGRGFDLDLVPADRQGVRGSIVDRLHRHGGTASVVSRPGSGTEVRMSMPAEGE
jgi:phage shock protein PspC (stress-responsive transcriptional regulator)/signal transduction histidine kinase